MSKIAEALARALAGVVSKTEDLWESVRQQYEDILETLTETSRRILLWLTPLSLLAIWLGGLTEVPPILVSLVYATVTLIVWVFVIDRYMRAIWRLQIGNWTVRGLVRALKGAGTSWPKAVQDAVIGIRKGIRNIFAVGLIPVLAAVWTLAADPYQQWLALLGVTLAALIGILGFLTPPEGNRGLLLFVMFVLLVGSAWWSATANPNSWYNQYQQDQATASSTTIPRCSQQPEMVVTYQEPGLTEYRVGVLLEDCLTDLINPEPGEWTRWKILPRDFASRATIRYNGGPEETLICQAPDTFYQGQLPSFYVLDGEGYLIVTVWERWHTGPDPYLCDD